MDLYSFFEKALSEVSSEFEKIPELTPEQADKLIREACEKFNVENVFCFVVLNEVVIPNAIFNQLQRQAVEALAKRQKEADENESSEEKFRKEMERLKERQEKKLQEMITRQQREVQKLNAEIATLKDTVTQLKKKQALVHA